MALPTINSVNPTSQPAVPAIEFKEAFLTVLHVNAMAGPGKPWPSQIKFRNFNAATGTLAADAAENNHEVRVDDIGALAAEYPAVAQTLGTVLVVSGLISALYAAKNDLDTASRVTPRDDEAIKAATAAYSAARAALGAS